MNKVKEYIKNHGMKVIWFCEQVGINPDALRAYFYGHKKLTDRQAVKIYLFLKKNNANIDFIDIVYPQGICYVIQKHTKNNNDLSENENEKCD